VGFAEVVCEVGDVGETGKVGETGETSNFLGDCCGDCCSCCDCCKESLGDSTVDSDNLLGELIAFGDNKSDGDEFTEFTEDLLGDNIFGNSDCLGDPIVFGNSDCLGDFREAILFGLCIC
jgi:hypothetical protein